MIASYLTLYRELGNLPLATMPVSSGVYGTPVELSDVARLECSSTAVTICSY
jgi:hypothetical protein